MVSLWLKQLFYFSDTVICFLNISLSQLTWIAIFDYVLKLKSGTAFSRCYLESIILIIKSMSCFVLEQYMYYELNQSKNEN